jgi:hypothetical protein
MIFILKRDTACPAPSRQVYFHAIGRKFASHQSKSRHRREFLRLVAQHAVGRGVGTLELPI